MIEESVLCRKEIKILKNFLKTTIPVIVLFIIYLCIWNVAESVFYSGEYNDYLFCISMAVIVTPMYYFVCMKSLGIGFEREINYVIQAGVFLSVVVLYSFLWPVEDYGYFQGLECIERLIRYSLMYLIGSAVYALVYYVVCSIRKGMYWDILRRLVSAILIFMVYSYLSEGIFPTISGIFVLVASTGICHLISMGILRVTYEKLSDYIFELSVLVCGKFLRNIIFGLDFYDEIFGIIGISILYAFANGVCFLIKSMWELVKEEKNRGAGDYRTYEDLGKRAISAIMGFPLYFLFTFIPSSWVGRIRIGEIVILIFFVATAVVTGIFRLISEKVIKVYYKNVYDHVILLSFFVLLSIIMYFAFYFINEDYLTFNLIVRHSMSTVLIYIIGNATYSIVNNEWIGYKKKKNEEIDKDCKEGKNESNKEDTGNDC